MFSNFLNPIYIYTLHTLNYSRSLKIIVKSDTIINFDSLTLTRVIIVKWSIKYLKFRQFLGIFIAEQSPRAISFAFVRSKNIIVSTLYLKRSKNCVDNFVSIHCFLLYFSTAKIISKPPPPTLRTIESFVTTNSITFKTRSETLHLCTQIRVKIECRWAVIRNDSNRASKSDEEDGVM